MKVKKIECSVRGCGRKRMYSNGLCNPCYRRWRRDPSTKVPVESQCSVDGCKRCRESDGFCNTHYLRWKRHGDPLAKPKLADDGAPQKFVEKAVVWKSDRCLIWPYYRSHGRASMAVNGKPANVSRIICKRVNGQPPTPKHEAAHECGNGHLGCINPLHLKWKTHAENQRDMVKHESWANQYVSRDKSLSR